MYGLGNLKSHIHVTPNKVECPGAGCINKVERQRHSFRREERFLCPEHKIYVSPSTFDYVQETDNLLWKSTEDLALLDSVKRVKRESRMSRDNSEDAVTWNVFRYLETTGSLAHLLSSITDTEHNNVELIYWSYSQKDRNAWPELNKTRKEFGENLQRSSELDLIAVTDQALFFIEAKLTATNRTIPSNRCSGKKYMIGGNEWAKYVFTSDFESIAIKSKLFELFRFWLLGTWLASQIGKTYYLINLVLSEREKNIESRFQPHIQHIVNTYFIRMTWEEIFGYIDDNLPENNEKRKVLGYFRNKTTGYDRFGNLQKAFSVD